MKIMLILLSLSFSSISYGLEGIQGNWCQFSPYNGEVTYRLEVDVNQDYNLFGQNEDGAVLNLLHNGVIDQGGSAATMVSDEEYNGTKDHSPNEIIVTEDRLTLVYSSGDIVYNRCQ
jgi:hypothetical protein